MKRFYGHAEAELTMSDANNWNSFCVGQGC